MTTPMRVTAYLDQPVIGLLGNALPLDGPLSWAAAQIDPAVGPITPEHAPEVDLPLGTWEQCGTWGWRASSARYEVVRWTSVELRRRPATTAMARYTTDRRHHLGLGPHKARNATIQACWVREISWDADVTDRRRLWELLGVLTHLGAHTNIGYGHVARWAVELGVEGAWHDRPMPQPGMTVAVRPPYWHPTRRVKC